MRAQTRTGPDQAMIHMPAAHKKHAASHALFLPHSTVGRPAPRDRLRPHHRSVLRHVHNDRLLDALSRQAQSALTASPGAPAYYDQQRNRGVDHSAALRQLANHLVGIPHDCLKTRTFYDEATT